MKINDIKNSKLDELDVVEVSKKSEFLLEVCDINNSVRLYKYDDNDLMEDDIRRINHAKNLILHG